MKTITRLSTLFVLYSLLSGCIVASAVGSVVGTAVNVVDAVTPDIID
ncbi:hypothetical protein [Conservatibacter flavescens]|nr:hypothetical protein [Conservatibacter flavescens]